MMGFTDTMHKLTKMKTNIQTIHRTQVNRRVATLAHNTLVPGIGEFNPLHNSYTAEKASRIVDGEASRHYNHFGVTVNDPRHVLFLPIKLLGHGLRHAGCAALCGKARELEIHANADSHLGSMIRARLMALRTENPTSPNFLRRAIVELATYGYFFRDTFDAFHSDHMERLLRADPDYAPALGTPGHSTSKTTPESKRQDIRIGPGHPELAKTYSYGSPLCTLLRPYTDLSAKFTGNPFKPTFWIPIMKDFHDTCLTPADVCDAYHHTARARLQQYQDSHRIFDWRKSDEHTSPLTSPSNHWTDRTPKREFTNLPPSS